MNLAPIGAEDARVQRIQEAITGLVASPGSLNTPFIATKQWIAVPVESASHFDKTDAARLSKAMVNSNYKVCLALATEPIGDEPNYYLLTVTPTGLLAFSRQCAHFNFLLVPENVGFGLLCTVFDYYVVAGPHDFVKEAVGGDLEAARGQFRDFASKSWQSADLPSMQAERQRLLTIADKYEQLK